MTATKKKQQSKPSGGGTLMGMRSGFKKAVGSKGDAKPAKGKWTFQQVFYLVGGVTLLIAVIYAFSRR